MRAPVRPTLFIDALRARVLLFGLRRRNLARARRIGSRSLLALPVVAVLLHDAARRGDRIAGFDGGGIAFYAASALCGALLWATLMLLAARRRGRARWVALAVGCIGAVLAVGAQAYAFARYAVYIDHQAVLVGTSMLPSIGQQLWSDRGTFAVTLLPPLALAIALPSILRALAPPRPLALRRAMDIGAVALLLATQVDPGRGGEQGQPPDVLYVSAMAQLARAKWDHNEMLERLHPGRRAPAPLPALAAKPGAKRDVVFVITESVRAMSVCVTPMPEGGCEFTPFSNVAAPSRLPLEQMRALDSTTAVSLAVLWSGLSPDAARADLHSAPLVWEYAHAAGFQTAYWTSQNLMFGNSGTWIEGLPLDKMVSATQIDPAATLEIGADDGALVDVALAELPQLRSPFFAVVHLSNTHFPYKIETDSTPFEDKLTDQSDDAVTRARYHDAVYLQDRAVARLVKGIRARPGGDETVIVFTSDHGEQLREKGSVGHTGTLFEEEVRVPFWIDAPPKTLTATERSALAALATTPLTHLDVLPTLLDLVGVWDSHELARFRARMPGESLLRGGSPDLVVPLTNCTELWQCAFKNWGAMRGSKKLIASQGDRNWRCFDVVADPTEHHDLDASDCGRELFEMAEEKRGRPFGHATQ